jgi:predicted phosphodiesterase
MRAQLMRVAALYDIHGNLPALEAVLAEVQQARVDRIVVGGDVFPGPMARECLECLKGFGTPVDYIRGNGESAVLAHLAGREQPQLSESAREAISWSAQELKAAGQCDIEGWPPRLEIPIVGLGNVQFCHATPRSDTEIFTRMTPEDRLVPIFEDSEAALIVCGHTHMQFDRKVCGTRVVNAGSVGMPFGNPGAYWLLLGPGVDLRHTRYDFSAAAARICSSQYPKASEFAERSVLEPPSEAQMLALFTKAGVG